MTEPQRATTLRYDDVDIAVRFGAGHWEGLTSEFMLRVDYAPVCSPALLDGAHPLRKPSDLRHHTLLHEDDYDGWTQWLAVADVGDVNPRRGPVLKDMTTLLQSAMAASERIFALIPGQRSRSGSMARGRAPARPTMARSCSTSWRHVSHSRRCASTSAIFASGRSWSA